MVYGECRGSFYLKNVYAETEGLNPYLSLGTNNTWTMVWVSEDNLAEANYFFRARFSLVDLGDGTWGIKTMSGDNGTAKYYTYIGCDAPGSDPDYTIWGDKLVDANGHYGHWTIDDLSTISVSRSDGQISITATNTTGATIYYTIDGTDPTTSATRQTYSAPFVDDDYALVKAIVMKDGRPNSELAKLYNYDQKFLLQNVNNNNAFYMLPGVANGDDYEVNTYSLMRPSMEWKLADAGDGDVYLQNDSTGYYLSCNSSGTVCLKATLDPNSNDFKFMLREGVDGSYRIEAKAKVGYYIYKADNNEIASVSSNNGKLNLQNYWNLLPSNPLPVETPPFTLSDAACAHYYRLLSAEGTGYYIIPPTGGSANATASNTGDDNDRWFIRQVAGDEWLSYYAFVNAKTGQCLKYNGAALGGSAAFETAMLSEAEMAAADNVQFAIARTTTSLTDGKYYLVPKPIRYQNSRNYYSLIRRNNTTLSVELQRKDNGRKWIFESSTFTCDAPVFSYDPIQGKVTITSPNNAPIYYVGYDDGVPVPTLTVAADGMLYTGPFDVTHTHYKAIVMRCTNGTDASSVATYNLTEPFRCATPVITYSTATQQVTITCATASATIYYTIDGTDPSSSSTEYTGPFTQTEVQVIKAIAIRGGDTSTASEIATYDRIPRFISSTAEIDDMDGVYAAQSPFTVTGTIGAEQPFTGEFDGAFVSLTLSQPLFGYVNGGTVKNVRVASLSDDLRGNNVGAIVNEASGNAKIYNCGVMDTTHTISGSNAAGGIVGHIASGASVRVVNCYNFATVAGTNYSGGIVGHNESDVNSGTRIAMCMMYGDMTVGTNRSPVYFGGHTSNNQDYTEYNYYRSLANLTYTSYSDQLAIDKNEYLTRFPFYRHILNTHRELAAFFLFHDSRKSEVASATEPSSVEVDEIGHWTLKPDVAPYPIVEPWLTNTKKTTVDINANLPNTTARYAGKKLDNITADGIYRGDGTQVTTMGSNGYLSVSISINGSSYTANLPITDMDTLNYDFTWGKVVLPFANEFSGWTRDYSKVCTGWKITSVTKDGSTYNSFNIPTNEPYNFADRDNPQKDIYDATNNPYIFAQGGNYIVPYGVTAITIEAHFANAFYLSDAQVDFGYDADYANQTNLGWTMPTTYHGQTVYTDLATLMDALATTTNPHQQAIVLVGNYHYNNKVQANALGTTKAVTIMSVDEDCNQEPDYGWYSYMIGNGSGNSGDRSPVPPLRFDFVPNIGIGMAARVISSTPYPSIGIWHTKGWFELTETSLSLMSECEIASSNFTNSDDGHGNNRWIANSGYFIQIVRCRKANCSKLSYIQIGGNAYVKELYPGSHSDNANTTTLVPINVTGGEIKECYMTGYTAGASATGSDIRFWCAGGRIHKFLGAYMENPSTEGVHMTAKVDHALIRRFFGGGTSSSARITGNIDVTMNNSRVDFYCGGPEFGDMNFDDGKSVTTRATGTTFGKYYGAGFGGTSITYNREAQHTNQQGLNFGNATVNFPLAFTYYTNRRAHYTNDYGFGSCYKFEYILFAGGNGSGVARFHVGYARFSLATTGSVTNTLTNCTILTDFYGAGCQGKVSGTFTSTLTDCTVNGSAFGGGYKATSNELDVYPTTQPTYSVYTKETGLFSDFGTVPPDTFTWEQGNSENQNTASGTTFYTSADVDMLTLGTVTGNISLTIKGNSTVAGNVFGGGNESPSNANTSVILRGNTQITGNVFGGGNKVAVGGASSVTIQDPPQP